MLLDCQALNSDDELRKYKETRVPQVGGNNAKSV